MKTIVFLLIASLLVIHEVRGTDVTISKPGDPTCASCVTMKYEIKCGKSWKNPDNSVTDKCNDCSFNCKCDTATS
ncbi:Hypothetical protein CINCED_3A001150 [Cinara cedri]|uniref:Uncharacterized protein n=1 Tax=Cinara cedri TaxID=506608 RepID=A0A5E4MBX7_9HEMI|nr:Hypothetical protein CINCED_3A001150 [Cinara cedri]